MGVARAEGSFRGLATPRTDRRPRGEARRRGVSPKPASDERNTGPTEDSSVRMLLPCKQQLSSFLLRDTDLEGDEQQVSSFLRDADLEGDEQAVLLRGFCLTNAF